MAHLWRAIVRNQGIDPKEEVNFKLVVDIRPRLNPPLPPHYFGNALDNGTVRMTAGELLHQEGLGKASSEMNKVVASFTEETIVSHSKSWLEDRRLLTISEMFGEAVDMGGSPTFNVYGVDFGWGKPVAVRSGPGDKFFNKESIEEALDIADEIASSTGHVRHGGGGGGRPSRCLGVRAAKKKRKGDEYTETETQRYERGLRPRGNTGEGNRKSDNIFFLHLFCIHRTARKRDGTENTKRKEVEGKKKEFDRACKSELFPSRFHGFCTSGFLSLKFKWVGFGSACCSVFIFYGVETESQGVSYSRIVDEQYFTVAIKATVASVVVLFEALIFK
ncbi:hypothetical protein K1719_014448 [Acacia pycnantha]|nr:hypothetical protein K1719_014448 [Acacia pycnantha]